MARPTPTRELPTWERRAERELLFWTIERALGVARELLRVVLLGTLAAYAIMLLAQGGAPVPGPLRLLPGDPQREGAGVFEGDRLVVGGPSFGRFGGDFHVRDVPALLHFVFPDRPVRVVDGEVHDFDMSGAVRSPALLFAGPKLVDWHRSTPFLADTRRSMYVNLV
jgi:hypothetical protein